MSSPLDPTAFYQNLPVLTTPRLRLRPLTAADAEDYFAFAGDPQVTQYLRWGPHPSLEHTRAYLNDVLAQYHSGEDGPWGIELLENNRLVGTIHLMEINPRNARADTGVVLAREYWGRGIGPEALGSVLDYAFQSLGMHRIQAYVLEGNQPARRMLEKCGLREEGFLRDFAFQKGQFRSFSLYAILSTDPQSSSP